jgi:hypothetical protein
MDSEKSLFVELYGKPRSEWTMRDHLIRLWIWRQEIRKSVMLALLLVVFPLAMLTFVFVVRM